MVELNDAEFLLLKKYLKEISGIEIPSNKRYLFKTRLSSFIQEQDCANFSVFYSRLMHSNDTHLQKKFIEEMTTHESSFFRDLYPYIILEKQLLPAFIKKIESNPLCAGQRIRILSAGCGKGQEPYSIAMVVKTWLEKQGIPKSISIVIQGIDISDKILAMARDGLYSDLEVGTAIPDEYRKKYLKKNEHGWTVCDEIRKMVSFSPVNLTGPLSLLGKYHVIYCRNVAIYFSLETKKNFFHNLKTLLHPEGALFLGSSENIYQISNDFLPIQDQDGFWYMPSK